MTRTVVQRDRLSPCGTCGDRCQRQVILPCYVWISWYCRRLATESLQLTGDVRHTCQGTGVMRHSFRLTRSVHHITGLPGTARSRATRAKERPSPASPPCPRGRAPFRIRQSGTKPAEGTCRVATHPGPCRQDTRVPPAEQTPRLPGAPDPPDPRSISPGYAFVQWRIRQQQAFSFPRGYRCARSRPARG